jgi:hypothetical protein
MTKRYSSKYSKDIIRLYNEDVKCYEIQKILGCSLFTVYNQLKINGIELIKEKKDNRSRNKDFIKCYLKTHPCIDCGNTDIRVLEFDHVKGIKDGNVSHSVRNNWSIDKIKEEIDKCEVRCCNCHRIVTIERRNKKN